MYSDRRAGDASGLAQEGCFPLIGLDQVEGNAGGGGQNKTGESSA
jgi:hypothetical protein